MVDNENNCSDLAGLKFNQSDGTFSWKLNFGQEGKYEFKITASDGGKVTKGGREIASVDSKLFSVSAENVNKPPQLFDHTNLKYLKKMTPLKKLT